MAAFKVKALGISLLTAAGALVVSSVCAAGYTPAGSFTIGPVPAALSYVGTTVTCHLTFYVNIPSTTGSGTIYNVVFTQGVGDSSLCPAVTANNLPWIVAAPTSAIGPNNVTITGVSITAPNVFAACTGSVEGNLNGSGDFSFGGTLHNGAIACGVSNGAAIWSTGRVATYP